MRSFSARETVWLQELDGMELAEFWQRACAFLIDWSLIALVCVVVGVLGALVYLSVHGHHPLSETVSNLVSGGGADHIEVKVDALGEKAEGEPEWLHVILNVLVPVLYFGTLLWKGKGRTPGKRLMRIRVVSIVHPHLTFWHSVERALGYGAAALEGGFGFLQFFIHPYRRCAQDRLAETIVVTERGYRAMQSKFEASH